MTKKVLLIILIVILILIGVVFAIRLFSGEDDWICENGEWVMHGKPSSSKPTSECNKTNELIGGQKDEHGCLTPAGYTWCEPKKKCLRSWEEKCE